MSPKEPLPVPEQPAAPAPANPAASGSGAVSEPGAAASGARGKSGGAHRATAWPEARAAAVRAGSTARTGREPSCVPLGQALGRVLAEPLAALTDLPPFDTSAMDGWAVVGPGPWAVREEGAVLAGHAPVVVPAEGEAVRIATGARVPPGTTAVLRSEHSRTERAERAERTDRTEGTERAERTESAELKEPTEPSEPTEPARPAGAAASADRPGPVPAAPLLLHALREVVPGQDIRPRGQECGAGDELLPEGIVVTPAVLGLAAAAGYDELRVRPRARVEILVLGDELLSTGLPREGLIRDALGPMLGPWLEALGAEVLGTRRIGDDAEALYAAVTGSPADLVVTTGGTASGPVDHVHQVLDKAGATLLVDGVKVRPGHPMLLAALGGRRHLVGLPGNPLAAVSGLLTLAEPLLAALTGNALSEGRSPVEGDVHGHPHDTRLVPVVRPGGRAVPLRYNGPAMLRGIAAADGLAVVPPGGARSGQELTVLDLPWPAAGAVPVQGACFT
ncbi:MULTISPECIES: molybdopterin molybdotransferase MoeA [Streptomyces]|uniref:Molybdopterin molybdenumtransferase n=1 Tax=Streptomyces viridochromogenes TaxID=1938 RepID=A0A0L8KQM4_STRVR|nr:MULTISPECIES: molybdopterin molybdotransferase MoeA [Streptomyces]KOG28039.1 molybdenum cofactor biosynthesis protein MoeA [Streptomyces viridochromogenes]